MADEDFENVTTNMVLNPTKYQDSIKLFFLLPCHRIMYSNFHCYKKFHTEKTRPAKGLILQPPDNLLFGSLRGGPSCSFLDSGLDLAPQSLEATNSMLI